MNAGLWFRWAFAVLLFIASVVVAVLSFGGVVLFPWSGAGDYALGLGLFLAGTAGALAVVTLAAPTSAAYERESQELDEWLHLPIPKGATVPRIDRQMRRVQGLWWRQIGQNVLVALIGGLIATALPLSAWWPTNPLAPALFVGVAWAAGWVLVTLTGRGLRAAVSGWRNQRSQRQQPALETRQATDAQGDAAAEAYLEGER